MYVFNIKHYLSLGNKHTLPLTDEIWSYWKGGKEGVRVKCIPKTFEVKQISRFVDLINALKDN